MHKKVGKHEKAQTIMHYANKQTLTKEHKAQKIGKAVEIDGVTKEQYGERLEKNLDGLLRRMKSFRYRPQAVRRTYIPNSTHVLYWYNSAMIN